VQHWRRPLLFEAACPPSIQCGGSEVLFVRAAGSSRELLNQNRTGIMDFQCPCESEVRNKRGLQGRANFGFGTPAYLAL
jgi:hypothetical protein